TSTPGAWLLQAYRLPARIRGARVLDLCAGPSDFAHLLATGGARAVAVDFHYQGHAHIAAQWRRWLALAAESRLGMEAGSPAVEDLFGEMWEKFGGQLRGPAVYVAASADALPFRDESFHVVTSFAGLFGTLDENGALLETATAEALRVLRPAGELQVMPALWAAWLSERQIANQRAVIGRLRGDRRLKVALARQEVRVEGRTQIMGRLTVKKR
ncbi:MAG: class I SAM-dependent methyltransferase, partial [Tepidiformaceae bacterium]